MSREYETTVKEIDEMLGKISTEITNREYKAEIKQIDEMLRNLKNKNNERAPLERNTLSALVHGYN